MPVASGCCRAGPDLDLSAGLLGEGAPMKKDTGQVLLDVP